MLGEFRIFSWKSKKAQEEEAQNYEIWAFPKGAEQRSALEERLGELLPKSAGPERLIKFLTCKELFDESFKTTHNEMETARHLVTSVKKYKLIVSKKEMPFLVAAVIADRRYLDAGEYESAEDISGMAAKLELFREGK